PLFFTPSLGHDAHLAVLAAHALSRPSLFAYLRRRLPRRSPTHQANPLTIHPETPNHSLQRSCQGGTGNASFFVLVCPRQPPPLSLASLNDIPWDPLDAV